MTADGSDPGLDYGRVEKDRIAKLARLRELGVPAYAYSFDPTHTPLEALQLLGAA